MNETEILDIASTEQQSAPTEFVLAEKSKRFVNLLIDTILFYIVFILIAGLIGIYEGLNNTSVSDKIFDGPIISRLFSALIYVIFFFTMEWFLKGRTIGKYATNTKTVMNDGSPLTFNAILKKSASRIVPFEAFSFLGSSSRGIHDNWSDTVVVDLKKVAIESNRETAVDTQA